MSRTRLVARNFGATLASQLISWGLTFVVTIYLPRYVGAKGLGALTLASSFGAIFGLFVSLGTSTVLIRDIARDHSRVGELVTAALVKRIPLGLLAVALGLAAAACLHYSRYIDVLIGVYLGLMVWGSLTDVFGSAVRGLEEIPRQNAAAVIEKVIYAGAIILLCLHKAPLWALALIGGFTSFISLSVNLYTVWPYLRPIQWPKWATMKSLAIAGLPFITTGIFVAIYGQSDALLLSKLSSLAAIGWYGLGKRLVGTTLMIPTALTSAMLPTLSRTYSEDIAAFQRAVSLLLRFMLICVIPLASVLVLAPGQILVILHYPPTFRPTIPVFVLLGFGVILWFLSVAAANVLIACDQAGVMSRVTGIAAVMSVPVCAASIYLTQRYLANGAVGAALSDVLIEAYMVYAYLRAVARRLSDEACPYPAFGLQDISVLVRAAVAALPMIGLLYFVHDKHSLYLAVPGILLYLPLCWLFRCLHPQDMRMVQQAFTRNREASATSAA